MRVNNRQVRKLLILSFCGTSNVDVDPVIGCRYLVEVGSVIDISEALSTSILRVEVRFTKCSGLR